MYEFNSYRFDPERRLLLRDNEVVALPAKAFDTLFVLIERRGTVVSKDELMKAVWPDSFVEEGNLSQSIHILRKALGEGAGDNCYIVTVPGRGYRFVASVRTCGNTNLEPDQRYSAAPDRTLPRERPVTRHISGSKWPRKWLVPRIAAAALVTITFLWARPSIARFYNNRGVRLQQRGDVKRAIENYQKALWLNPDYAEAHYNLGDAFEEIPDYDRALAEYKRAIDADLTFYEAYNNLSRLYILHLKDYPAALRLLDRSTSLKPKEMPVQYSLYKNYGWATLELHQLVQAEDNLRSAVRLDPSRGSAHCLLAKVLDAGNRTADAVVEWESCAADSNQSDVEPEWRSAAQDRLRRTQK